MNKAQLIGHLGKDPEIRSMQSSDKVCNFTLATSERWTDKATGERKERTEWHRVVIFNPHLIALAERYLKKGSRVYVEGQIETRKWDDKGQERYMTEIVLRQFGGEIELLDGARGSAGEQAPAQAAEAA